MTPAPVLRTAAKRRALTSPPSRTSAIRGYISVTFAKREPSPAFACRSLADRMKGPASHVPRGAVVEVRKHGLEPYVWMLISSFAFSWMGIFAHLAGRGCPWQLIAIVR